MSFVKKILWDIADFVSLQLSGYMMLSSLFLVQVALQTYHWLRLKKLRSERGVHRYIVASFLQNVEYFSCIPLDATSPLAQYEY